MLPHVYYKRGYFRWEKISRKYWQDLSRGGNFHDNTHIAYCFNKVIWVLFLRWGIFLKRQCHENAPREKFHVHNILPGFIL